MIPMEHTVSGTGYEQKEDKIKYATQALFLSVLMLSVSIN